jgi:hypothetical protein
MDFGVNVVAFCTAAQSTPSTISSADHICQVVGNVRILWVNAVTVVTTAAFMRSMLQFLFYL